MNRNGPAILLVAALGAGCAVTPPVMINVPFHVQEEGHCGEAALAMLLEHTGRKADPDLLRRRLHLPVLKGTVTDLMVQFAREQGLASRRVDFPNRAEAEKALRAPMAALLGPFDRDGVGHYVVITGFKSGRWVSVHTGKSPHERMEWTKFMDRWSGSEYEGMIITP